jgi:hypothetical protein
VDGVATAPGGHTESPTWRTSRFRLVQSCSAAPRMPFFFPAASRHASVLVALHARAVDGHVLVLDTRRRGARSDLDGRAQRQRHGGLD